MADFNVKVGGTKSSGSSASWELSECYPTLLAALAQATDGSNVVLEDETHTEVAVAPGSSWTDSMTIKSRGGNAANCTLQNASQTDPLLAIYPGAGTPTIVIEDITLTCAASRTGTSAAAAFIGVSSNTVVELTFNRVVVADISILTPSSSAHGQIFHHAGNKVRDINFNDCIFRDITAINAGYSVLFGLWGTSSTFKFNGTMFRDWTLTYNAQAAGEYLGVASIAGMSFIDCTWQDITRNSPQRSMIRPQGTTSTMEILNAKFYRILSDHNTGEFIGTPLVDIFGPFTVEKVYAEDVEVVVPETNGGGDGILLYQSGSAAVGTFRDIEVHRCHGRSGSAVFASNGANLDVQGVRAYNCNVAHGVIYQGYNGDADIAGVLVKDCRYYSLTGSNRHAGGLAIYCRNNPAAPAADSTFNISNVTLIDNDNDALSEGIEIQNEHATASVTATLNNIISRNSGTLEIKYLKTSGTGSLDVTTNNMNIKGGAGSITTDDGTGTTVTNNVAITSADPNLNSDGSLPEGSTLSAIGYRWWTGAHPIDANLEPLPNVDIDVGGIQGTDAANHPFHPLNL